MKSQTQYIGNYSNVFDYSPFGTPLDGRTVENVFSQLKADTIVVADTLFIINNDFENAVIEPNGAGVKIDGWTHYSPSTTLDVATINGSKKLKVISTNGTHGAHQAFAVEPGESYTFEIDLHRPAGMNKEINVVIWKNTGPSGALSVHVLNVDGTNTFTYNATSSDIFIQIRQAGTYYLDNEVTNIIYTDREIINPETGKLYENEKGSKLTIPVQARGGEVTITLLDAGKGNLKNTTQNSIHISKEKIHSIGEYNDPRENNMFHGMGHVLYQKDSEQEKVIDFDNISRKLTGAPKRKVDSAQKNIK